MTVENSAVLIIPEQVSGFAKQGKAGAYLTYVTVLACKGSAKDAR